MKLEASAPKSAVGVVTIVVERTRRRRFTDWPMPENWHLIVDEIPSPDRFFDMHLPVNHGFLTDRKLIDQWLDRASGIASTTNSPLDAWRAGRNG